jgi:hypothetical protein
LDFDSASLTLGHAGELKAADVLLSDFDTTLTADSTYTPPDL